MASSERFVVYDINVEVFVMRLIKDGTLKGVRDTLAISATEEDKTMEKATEICRWLLGHRAGRSCTVFAVGGGLVTDLVGFAASVYKRGVRLVLIPTTVLAQCDAAIGGKCGVNLDGVKNSIGLFIKPHKTIIRTDALDTLDIRQIRSGIAEMLKTFLIADGKTYRRAVDAIGMNSDDRESLIETLRPFILKAGKIKRGIVRRDPLEKGRRRILNLGHTYGHAIEMTCGLTHGESVAIGIVMAAELSEKRGFAASGLAGRIKEDFRRISLPTEITGAYGKSDITDLIYNDKKAVGENKLEFVFLKREGKAVRRQIRIDSL